MTQQERKGPRCPCWTLKTSAEQVTLNLTLKEDSELWRTHGTSGDSMEPVSCPALLSHILITVPSC